MSNELLSRYTDFYRAFLFLKEQIFEEEDGSTELCLVSALHEPNLAEMFKHLDLILKDDIADKIADTDALTTTLIAEQLIRADE